MKRSSKIVAILAANYEFFLQNGEVFFLYKDRTFSFSNLSSIFVEAIRIDLENHPKALKTMEEIGIIDPIEQNKQWSICNFGDFALKSHLTSDGVIVLEHENCIMKGSCHFEGLICKSLIKEDFSLTPRELQIIKFIVRDMLDKEISSLLGISTKTLSVHIHTIIKKIGCHSKVGITAFAFQTNLI